MASHRYFLCCTFCLCVCFLVVIGISNAASNNEYYYYNTDSLHPRTEHSLHIERLKEQDLHNHQKRDVESPQLPANLSAPVNSTEKVKSLEVLKVVKNVLKNVGVNGTGQRTNITTVKPQPTLIHNGSSTVNTPVKNASSDDVDDPSSILPLLTPEEVGVGDELDAHYLADKNITTVKTDTHTYYNSTTYNDPEIGKSFWVDMDKRSNAKIHDSLSNSHRRAATVKLSFEFPFYGHYIKNVTIATGGFLYTGHYVHSWLAATQYIAPLMANFDTSLSNDSLIKLSDNETALTVQWERVSLKDRPREGEFTFQVTLHKNGDIVFVYKNVPLLIKDISDNDHPVKIGLSDAYIVDRTVFYTRKKVIFEYHRVTFYKEEVKNWTAIYLTALPTCLDMHNCSSCLKNDLKLNCTWCSRVNQCSTGQDRNRQNWIDNGCESRNVSIEPHCSLIDNTLNYDIEEAAKSFDSDFIGQVPSRQSQFGASGYIAIIFLIAMISGFAVWTMYAYRNPHTASGQILIRYRPSQWRWRRGEARYTAATIHM